MGNLSPSNGPVTIGTHNGVFHADDVLAAAVLRTVFPDCTIVRTRDDAQLATCDVVFDVGGVYDPSTNRFDHHQKGRAGARSNGVLYSSFGLVWKAFGFAITGDDAVTQAVDVAFVQPIDAVDNGQQLYAGGRPAFEGVFALTLGASISSLNPSWHEEAKDFDQAFGQAVGIAQKFLQRAVADAQGVAKARQLVAGAIEARAVRGNSAALDQRVVFLDQFIPWGDQVRDDCPEALFVMYPSETGTWMVQAVNSKAGTFESRKLLPEAWQGLRGEDFASATGVEGGVFCHPGRFICGAETMEGAVKLANMAARA